MKYENAINIALVAWMLAKQEGKAAAIAAAALELEQLLAGGMAMADLTVQTEVLLEAWKLAPKRIVSPPIIHETIEWPVYTGSARVPVFKEALGALKSRVPKAITPAWKRTAAEVGRLYGSGGGGVVTAVQAADVATSAAIKRQIARQIEQGVSLADVAKGLQAQTKGWTRAYSRLVVQTNLSGVRAEGRIKQASNPAVAKIIAGLRFQAIGDGRVRPNHLAANGTIAPANHPIWEKLKTPLGYNCRCTLALVTWGQAATMGLVLPDGTLKFRPPKPGAGPDPGFRR